VKGLVRKRAIYETGRTLTFQLSQLKIIGRNGGCGTRYASTQLTRLVDGSGDTNERRTVPHKGRYRSGKVKMDAARAAPLSRRCDCCTNCGRGVVPFFSPHRSRLVRTPCRRMIVAFGHRAIAARAMECPSGHRFDVAAENMLRFEWSALFANAVMAASAAIRRTLPLSAQSYRTPGLDSRPDDASWIMVFNSASCSSGVGKNGPSDFIGSRRR
jgi:hypothetical protein